MDHSLEMCPYIDAKDFKPDKKTATVNFKMNLAEIWDFYLDFADWKTSNIKNDEKPKSQFSTYVAFELFGVCVIVNKTKSATEKNTFLPYWKQIDKGLIFRGTYHELKSAELLI